MNKKTVGEMDLLEMICYSNPHYQYLDFTFNSVTRTKLKSFCVCVCVCVCMCVLAA